MRPPQSNYPPYNVPTPDHGARLELQVYQGGISRLAPPQLAPWFQSLPPILHKQTQRSEEHTSELQSLMRISSAVFCLKTTMQTIYSNYISSDRHSRNYEHMNLLSPKQRVP